jgi:DNA-nicking Smr family endonuclease
MDFEKILAQWDYLKKNENQKNRSKENENIIKHQVEWLEKHPPTQKDKLKREIDLKETNHKKEKIKERQRLKNMAPQKTLDLHGLTVKEASVAVENFLKICQAQGYEKVLIIHGKGIHSKEGPVLNEKIRKFIEQSPLAGEIGTPPLQLGGKGALWVIIRHIKE